MKINADDMLKVSVIGAGSYGTAIAKVIAENFPSRVITLWCYEKSVSVQINTVHSNDMYLPEIPLPENITATNNIQKAVEDADLILITVPSKNFADIATQAVLYFRNTAYIALMSKGFVKIQNEFLTMSGAFAAVAPQFKGKTVSIYGPSLSTELGRKFHTALMVASKDEEMRKIFCGLFENDFVSCRESADVTGCELGGALKNPVAIAAGVISMLPGCGDNINGVLLSQGFMEMVSVAKALGALPETLMDIAGLGDLVSSSFSGQGRNRQFGRELFREYGEPGEKSSLLKRLARNFVNIFARPGTVNQKYLAEGIYAITPIIEIARKHSLSVPLFSHVYDMIQGKSDGVELLKTLKRPDRVVSRKRNVFSELLDMKLFRLLWERIRLFILRMVTLMRNFFTRK
jgi:glycerol-3-phosphate dehydrogenase (NAD(P)+)